MKYTIIVTEAHIEEANSIRQTPDEDGYYFYSSRKYNPVALAISEATGLLILVGDKFVKCEMINGSNIMGKLPEIAQQFIFSFDNGCDMENLKPFQFELTLDKVEIENVVEQLLKEKSDELAEGK